jgi:hypothetical protein
MPNPAKAKVKVTAPDVEDRFLTTMTTWLAALPHDLKVLYEASADENLPRAARLIATGAIIAIVDGQHLPGHVKGDFVNYCDSVILLRLALRRLAAAGEDAEDNEDLAFFKDRFDDYFLALDDEVTLCREALGPEAFTWLESKADKLEALEFRSKKVPHYIDDDDGGEFLYEEGLAFQTEYEVDDDVLVDRLKRFQTVLDAIDARMRADGAR